MSVKISLTRERERERERQRDRERDRETERDRDRERTTEVRIISLLLFYLSSSNVKSIVAILEFTFIKVKKLLRENKIIYHRHISGLILVLKKFSS